MPVLQHTKPCTSCPFRRTSAPGWLGASTAEEFLGQTLGENAMPCHPTIDYEKADWRTRQLPEAPLCAGALVFLRNIAKLPRCADLAAARNAVAADRVEVFGRPDEFLAHHKDHGPMTK